jgi:competence protein ComFC
MYFLKQGLMDIVKKFLALIFPTVCLGCKKEGQVLCAECFAQIKTLPYQQCPICYRSNENGEVCVPCSAFSYIDKLLVACSYKENPVLRDAIHVFKYEGAKDLAPKLASLFPKISSGILCPVPLHKKRQKWRGYNQSQLLAENLAKSANLKIDNCLERIKFRKPQMELTREERLKNMEGAFRALPPLPEEVTLIDDVATTLATLQSAAKELKKNGVQKVNGIVLSRVN